MLAGAAAALLVTGCADDDPTSVGTVVVDPAELVTFEVLLDADRFLDHAATFDGYTRRWLAPFLLIAEQAGGAMDAHTLMRFQPSAASVEYRNSEGELQTDTAPDLIDGTLIVDIDTAVSSFQGSVPLRLYRIAESWDEPTTTWTLRADTAGGRISWTQPGGTTAAVIDSAVLAFGADSVVFAVDSQTIALWAENSGGHGALLAAAEPGTRLFATGLRLRLRARPSPRPDTVVNTVLTAVDGTDETFIYSPDPGPPGSRLRIGGTPAWRAFLRFRERLDTMTVAVPFEGDTIRLPLSEATLNFAALELAPDSVAGGFRPEEDIPFVPHTVTESSLIPLARSPVGPRITFSALIAPATAFSGTDSATARVDVELTSFMRDLLRPLSSDDENADDPARTIVLVPTTETFGFGAFQAAGDEGPRLRLVLTVVKGGGE